MARGRKTGGRKAGTPNKSTAEVKALAQHYGAAALEKLNWLMHNAESDMTKLMACKEILDRAYGKPSVGSAMAASAEKTDHQLEQIQLFIVDPSPAEAVANSRQRRGDDTCAATKPRRPSSSEPRLEASYRRALIHGSNIADPSDG